MEGNLGNTALYPGLVPAECRLTNCFCLGKENKPYLGAETFWDVPSCLRLACIASQSSLLGPQPSTLASAEQSLFCSPSFTREKEWRET